MIDWTDPNASYFPLSADLADDLRALSRQLPATPAAYSELRRLIDMLPSAQMVSELSARSTPSATADELTFAEQSLLQGPGPSSVPASSVSIEQPYVGMPNLIRDPTLSHWNVYGMSVKNAEQVVSVVYSDTEYDTDAWLIASSDTEVGGYTAWETYVNAKRDSLEKFNSADVIVQVGSMPVAGTYTCYVRSTDHFVNWAAGTLPYLVASARVGPRGLIGNQTLRKVTVQIWNSNHGLKASTDFDVGAQTQGDFYRVSAAYLVPQEEATDQFYMRVLFTVTVSGATSYGNFNLGDPQLHSAPSPTPLPFSPDVTNWHDTGIYSMNGSTSSDTMILSWPDVVTSSQRWGFRMTTGGGMSWGKYEGLRFNSQAADYTGYPTHLTFSGGEVGPDYRYYFTKMARLEFRSISPVFGNLQALDSLTGEGNSAPQMLLTVPRSSGFYFSDSTHQLSTNARMWGEQASGMLVIDGGTPLDLQRQERPHHWWLLNEQVGDFGDKGYDSVAATLTANGSMTRGQTGPFDPGQPMKSTKFTGGYASNGAVNMGTAPSGTYGIVVEGWFKLDAFPDPHADVCILHMTGNLTGAFPRIQVWADTAGGANARMLIRVDPNNSSWTNTILDPAPAAGSWHHIAVGIKNYSLNPRVWVDGVEHDYTQLYGIDGTWPSGTLSTFSVALGAGIGGAQPCTCYLSSWALHKFDATYLWPVGNYVASNMRVRNRVGSPAVVELDGTLRLTPYKTYVNPGWLPVLETYSAFDTSLPRFAMDEYGDMYWSGPGGTADIWLGRPGTRILQVNAVTDTQTVTFMVTGHNTGGTAQSNGIELWHSDGDSRPEWAVYSDVDGHASMEWSDGHSAPDIRLHADTQHLELRNPNTGGYSPIYLDIYAGGASGSGGEAAINVTAVGSGQDASLALTSQGSGTAWIVLYGGSDLGDAYIDLWPGAYHTGGLNQSRRLRLYAAEADANPYINFGSGANGAAFDVRLVRSDTKELRIDDTASGDATLDVFGRIRVDSLTMLQWGTSFPGSPATGDRFYRSDRGIDYFYDGTRWLSSQLFTISFGPGDYTNPITSDGSTLARIPSPFNPGGGDIWLDTAVFASFSSGGDGTKYWTLQMTKLTVGNVATVVANRTTSGDTQGNWVRAEVSIDALLGTPATYPEMQFIIGKTSTPTSVYATVSLTYRLVG